ncbi:hypothetical protein EJV47_08855 [Hymenobacter gummosus]|uniref:DUF308 domain-containing protein n=1 Tax=Hymenobacter gummosus TaxID=1776032 RepID=A0A3S0JF38_9BACT|nr:DUF308 domain-containing protein [Hymenobacter gummosus]RTQ50728.1 hypothetical protein EJV47_08855 [Hymenobacter gummosus]
MSTLVSTPAAPPRQAQGLRNLYLVRAGFSLIWVTLLLTAAPSSAVLTAGLLLLYPTWDVLATLWDVRLHHGTASLRPQYLNIGIGVLTTGAVVQALRQGLPTVMQVFGAWAIVTGLLQLLLALRRRRQLGGQWPLIISGAQSTLGGLSFILMAHDPATGLPNLAGYSAFGAFYFLLAAYRLHKAAGHPAAS